MQNELERAKQNQELKIGSELTSIGVNAVHEDKHHQEVHAMLQSVHTEAGVAKEAVPAITEPTANLIRLPEPIGKPMEDSSWGGAIMARKFLERIRMKGELPDAA
jgi:hypothetical protein